jgi:type II secretory pathway component PulL
MSARSFVIFPGRSRWRVAAVRADDGPIEWRDVEPGAATDEVAARVAETLRRAGYRGRGGVVLAVPSEWCVSATVSTENLPRRDRKALLYRLEEKLPLAAEEVVADFVDGGPAMLGVCARVELLRPVVDALEANGIAVQSIAPAAMLAAQSLPARPSPHVLVLGGRDVIAMSRGAPAAWSLAGDDAADLKLHAELARAALGAEAPVESVELNADEAAAKFARLVLQGRGRAWVELRRDALAPRDRLRAVRPALNAALASAAMLLVVLAGAALLRAQRYESSARADDRATVDLFRAEFPGWAVPVNVGAVVESEHRRLAAQQRGAARQASAESALGTLTKVLGSVAASAAEARLAVERMSFDDRGFALEGRVAAPADLDAVSEAIRASGLRVAPAQAQRESSDSTGAAPAWRFTLRGEAPATTGARGEVSE